MIWDYIDGWVDEVEYEPVVVRWRFSHMMRIKPWFYTQDLDFTPSQPDSVEFEMLYRKKEQC